MTRARASLAKGAAAGPIDLAALRKQLERYVKAGDVPALRELEAKARGVETYVRQKAGDHKESRELANGAAEAVVRIQRALGTLFVQTLKRGNPKKSRSAPFKLEEIGVTKKESSRWQKLAKVPEERFEDHIAVVRERCGRLTSTGLIAAASESKSYQPDEHYSPADYVELVREVLGEIELDPATSLRAQETVVAQRFYTKAEDGLAHDWSGRVFMNPPYSDPAPFVAKLLEHLGTGDVPEAIVLTNNTTDTEWAQSLLEASSAVCFTRGRIAFDRPDSKANKGTRQGQIFFYLGNDPESFVAAFEEFNFDADKEPIRNAILRPASPLHVPEEDEADVVDDEAEEKPAAGDWFDEEQPEASA